MRLYQSGLAAPRVLYLCQVLEPSLRQNIGFTSNELEVTVN